MWDDVQDLKTCCEANRMCTNCRYYDFKLEQCSITKEERHRFSDICDKFEEMTEEQKAFHREEQEEIARTYWEFVINTLYRFSNSRDFFYMGRLYGLDRQRLELHQRLCDSWGFEHNDEDMLAITDNLDHYDLDDFIQALYKLKHKKENL